MLCTDTTVRQRLTALLAALAWLASGQTWAQADSTQPRRPFTEPACTQLRTASVLLRSHDPWGHTTLGAKAIVDWTAGDIEYTRQQVQACLQHGQLSTAESGELESALSSLPPRIQEESAKQTLTQQERVQHRPRSRDPGESEAQPQPTATEIAAEAMLTVRRVAKQLSDYPEQGTADLRGAIVELKKLKAAADAARMKDDSTNVEQDREAFGVQQTVNARIEAYAALLQSQCFASLQSSGLPSTWLNANTRLAFSTGYDEPLGPLLCAWRGHGVRVVYHAPSYNSSDGSLRIEQAETVVVLELHETRQANITFLVPTAYSGPEGTIRVEDQRGLQQIFALLTQFGR